MLDKIADQVVDDLALEGEQGCNWNSFWSLVENVTLQSFQIYKKEIKVTVDKPYKESIWKFLRINPDILVFLNNKPKKALDIYFDELETHQENVLFKTVEEMQDVKIYGKLKHLKKTLTKQHKLMLYQIAKAKHKGIAQFILARNFGLDTKKAFHYLVKIEKEGLIVKNSAYTDHMRTNMIYLKQFAPKTNLKQKEEAELTDVVFTLDSFQSCVLNQLNMAKDNMMSLQDIISTLGFKTERKKRWARTQMSRLHNQGVIEKFSASDGKSQRISVRLRNTETTATAAIVENAETKKSTQIYREYSYEYQLYQTIAQAGEKGITRRELVDKYPLISHEHMTVFCKHVAETPKDPKLHPWIVYKVETMEGKQRLFRYFDTEGWEKYKKSIERFIQMGTELPKTDTEAPPIEISQTDIEMTEAPPMETSQADAEMTESTQMPKTTPRKRKNETTAVSEKKPRWAHNTTRVRRTTILLEIIQRDLVREFNQDLLRDFTKLEVEANGQVLARKTLGTLIKRMAELNQIKIYVVTIKRFSGVNEPKTFILHTSMTPESEQVKHLIENYTMEKTAGSFVSSKKTRQELSKVNVHQLPGKVDKDRQEHSRDNLWRRGFAARYGYSRSRFVRAKELHLWCVDQFENGIVHLSQVLQNLPMVVLLKICSMLPFEHDRFVEYIDVSENKQVKLAQLPNDIQSLILINQIHIRNAIISLLTILKALELMWMETTDNAYQLSRVGKVKDFHCAERPVLASYPLNTLEEVETYWDELRMSCLFTHENTVNPMEKDDPLYAILSGHGWGSSFVLTKEQRDTLDSYVDVQKRTTPVDDTSLCVHLGKKLQIGTKRVRQYFLGIIQTLEKKTRPEKKKKRKNTIKPSAAVSELMKISLENRKYNTGDKPAEYDEFYFRPTFVGSRPFKQLRMRTVGFSPDESNNYTQTRQLDPFSDTEKDMLLHAYSIMIYRAKQSHFYWSPIEKVLLNRTRHRCRRVMCSMAVSDPNLKNEIRRLTNAWERIYNLGIAEGDIRDDRPFETKDYDLSGFLEYFILKLNEEAMSAQDAKNRLCLLPQSCSELRDNFQVKNVFNPLQVVPSQSLNISNQAVQTSLGSAKDDISVELVKILFKKSFMSHSKDFSVKATYKSLKRFPENVLTEALKQLREQGLVVHERTNFSRVPGRKINVSDHFLELTTSKHPVGLFKQCRIYYNEIAQNSSTLLKYKNVHLGQFATIIDLISQQKAFLDFNDREKYLRTKRSCIYPKRSAVPLVQLYIDRNFDIIVQTDPLPLSEPTTTTWNHTIVPSKKEIKQSLYELNHPLSVRIYATLKTCGVLGMSMDKLRAEDLGSDRAVLDALNILVNHRPPLIKLVGFRQLRYVVANYFSYWLLKSDYGHFLDPVLWCDTSGQVMEDAWDGCCEVIQSHIIKNPGIQHSVLCDKLTGFLSDYETHTILEYLEKNNKVYSRKIKKKNSDLFSRKKMYITKDTLYTGEDICYWIMPNSYLK